MKYRNQQDPHAPAAGYLALCALAQQGKGKRTLNVSVKTVREILAAYEEMLDIVAYDSAKREMEKTEFFPKEIVDRLIAGEHKLKVYREYRGLTQHALAEASGVSRDMIAMMETGKKKGSITTNRKLAAALTIDLEDLI